MLEKLFTSKTRLKLLQLFLSHRLERYYQRQLEKLLGVGIRSLQIELNNLLKIGFLKKEKDGNRIYYIVNEKFQLLEELNKLVLKGSFFIDKLKNLLSKPEVELAFIYGSAAHGDMLEESDIDLFIVGNVDSYKLHSAIKEIEKDFSRVINYVIYNKKEVCKKVQGKSGFIINVIDSNKFFIKGSEDEFRKIIE